MGRIVGAALASHHPGLMQSEDFRRMTGAGEDSDLIEGYARLRERIETAKPDVVLIFDTHWFTTGYHLIDGGTHYQGSYISDEMPWYLWGVPYDYSGHPELALAIESVGKEKGIKNRNIARPDLPRNYPTINLVKQLHFERLGLPVVSVSTCQHCRLDQYLSHGEVIGEAIRRNPWSVLLIASGALSHQFVNIDWIPNHPSLWHESNVSSPENAESDKRAIDYLVKGRHDEILVHWDDDFRKRHWEGWGAHYLQMIGALGGEHCRAKGEPLSRYENARGTGNIHIWFETQ